jgi:hypothetical protein
MKSLLDYLNIEMQVGIIWSWDSSTVKWECLNITENKTGTYIFAHRRIDSKSTVEDFGKRDHYNGRIIIHGE